MNSDQWTFLLDLDNTYKGLHSWPLPDRPWAPPDLAATAEFLRLLDRTGSVAIALTRRPPGQMASLELNGAFALAEEGASIWSAPTNTIRTNPKFEEFSRDVQPEVLSIIRRELPVSHDGPLILECGDRRVSACIHGRMETGREWTGARIMDAVRQPLSHLPVKLEQGMGVDILPATPDLTKATACEWLDEGLFEEYYGRPIEWERVIYIDDAASAIPAAEWVAGSGGVAACVANAAVELKAVVESVGGRVSGSEGTRGCIEIVEAVLGI